MQRDHNPVAFTGKKFVDRIVNDFPQQMVQPSGIHTADVHRGTSPYGLQTFEHLDVFTSVISRCLCRPCHAYRPDLLALPLPNQSHTAQQHPFAFI